MGAQAPGAPAEHERSAARHADHPPVDHVGLARHTVGPVVGHVGRIGVVVARVAVDEQDRDRGVPAAVEQVVAPSVHREVARHPRPQVVVEGDHAELVRCRTASIPS